MCIAQHLSLLRATRCVCTNQREHTAGLQMLQEPAAIPQHGAVKNQHIAEPHLTTVSKGWRTAGIPFDGVSRDVMRERRFLLYRTTLLSVDLTRSKSHN